MAKTSTYSEVTASDRDVALFLAASPHAVNFYALPVKAWVARENGRMVAILMLKTQPYLSLDLVRVDEASRPFMRILKLYRMAEAWLKERKVPIVAVAIRDDSRHFQSLVRRFGFVPIGASQDDDGNQVETIFGKVLRDAAPVEETHA
jgi:hypothetical protein